MREFLRRRLRRGLSMLVLHAAALGCVSASAAAVSYEFTLLAQYKDKVPLPANSFGDQPDPIPLFGVFDENNSPIGQTFHATLVLAGPLPANQPMTKFSAGQVLGFSAQIGDEVWGPDSEMTLGHGYATDAAGNLTQIVFDFRSANGNGISVWVDAWRTLWIATQFYFPGYDDLWERGMCGVDNQYVFSGTCFGGREIGWALVPPAGGPGPGEDPPLPGDPPAGNEVPEPAGLALAGTAAGAALWAGRRRAGRRLPG